MVGGGYYIPEEDLVLEGHYEEEEYTLYKNTLPVEPPYDDDIVALNEIMRITSTESLAFQCLLKVLPLEIWEDILVKGFRLAQKEERKTVKAETSNSLWTQKFKEEKYTPKYYKGSALLVYWYWIILPTNQLRNNPSFIRKIIKECSFVAHVGTSNGRYPVDHLKDSLATVSCDTDKLFLGYDAKTKKGVKTVQKGCRQLIDSLKQKKADLHIFTDVFFFYYLDHNLESWKEMYRLFRVFFHITDSLSMIILNHSINPLYTLSSVFGVEERDCLYFCCEMTYLDIYYIRFSHIGTTPIVLEQSIDIKDLEDKMYCSKYDCSLNLDNPSEGSKLFPECSIDQSIKNHAKLEKLENSICYRHIAEAGDEHDNCVYADCCFQMLMYHEFKEPGGDDPECIPQYYEKSGNLTDRDKNLYNEMYIHTYRYHFNKNLFKVVDRCFRDHLIPRRKQNWYSFSRITGIYSILQPPYIREITGGSCSKTRVKNHIKEQFNTHKIYQHGNK